MKRLNDVIQECAERQMNIFIVGMIVGFADL